MSEDFENGPPPVKEFDERALNVARFYSLLRQECEMEEPWHIMVLATCAFERMHIKDGWEFFLTNRKDIEDLGELFENSNSPDEFREGLIKLKEDDLKRRMGEEEI